MIIKIDKNIPMPVSLTTKYPLLEMEIGDSFLACDKHDAVRQSSISTQIRVWAASKKYDWKFTVRKTDHGIRVWRTK